MQGLRVHIPMSSSEDVTGIELIIIIRLLMHCAGSQSSLGSFPQSVVELSKGEVGVHHHHQFNIHFLPR